jgi:hypothetical protein
MDSEDLFYVCMLSTITRLLSRCVLRLIEGICEVVPGHT